MIPRNDLLAPEAPAGLEVFQLTDGPLPSVHVYMEAQVFSPDSTGFLLHEAAHAHGADWADLRHRYLACDLAARGALRPLIHEAGAIAPSVSPDGRHVYYFTDETRPGGGRFALKRVGFDGLDRRTLLVQDTPLPGVGRYASRFYPLSTIRSDGRKLAISCFLGNGREPEAPWGLLVCDLLNPAVELVLSGSSWCNVHPQYCRARDREAARDILVQENHGYAFKPDGTGLRKAGGSGADVHVIRDDGRAFRDLPWGRDGSERCQGHQCWRGMSGWAITSTMTENPLEQQLIESRPVPPAGHAGALSPGGRRNHLSANYPGPCFYHFATDRAGGRLITDTGAADQGGRVFLAVLGRPGRDPARAWTCLVRPGSSWRREAHIHPFLSPDGALGFFNSDETGTPQAYMIRGLGSPG